MNNPRRRPRRTADEREMKMDGLRIERAGATETNDERAETTYHCSMRGLIH